MHESIINAHKRIDSKVNWWIISALIGIFVAMLGANYYQTNQIKDKVTVLSIEMGAVKKKVEKISP